MYVQLFYKCPWHGHTEVLNNLSKLMYLLETHTEQSHKSPSEGWWSKINGFFYRQILTDLRIFTDVSRISDFFLLFLVHWNLNKAVDVSVLKCGRFYHVN